MENQIREFQQEETIDLVEIYFLFRQRVKQMIAVLFAGMVLAGVVTKFLITPLYEATASLYVVSASDSVVDLSDLQLGASLTADYEILLTGRPMMESVIQNLSLQDTTVKSLRDQISISNPSDTRILQITVTDESPEMAAKIANEIANLGVTWLPEVMGTEAPNVAEDAVAPQQPSSPSLIKNVALGGMLALVLYCGIVVVKFLLNDTIRSSEEFERYFGIVPLAVIPECGDDREKRSKRTRSSEGTTGNKHHKKGA